MRWVVILVFAFGCKDSRDIKLRQRTDGEAPGLAGVHLHLGDVTLRRVELRVSAPDGALLAAGTLREGEELPFVHKGKPRSVAIVEFEEHTITDDYATLRVHDREAVDVLRLTPGATVDVAAFAGSKVTATAMFGDNVTLEITTPSASGRATLAPGASIALEYHGTPIEVVMFGRAATDTVYVRVRRM